MILSPPLLSTASRLGTLALLFALCFAQVSAAEPIPFSKVAPILKQHCSRCHDSATPKAKGDLRIDKLNSDLVQGKDGDHWREVLDRLNFGDMPPKTEPKLDKAERELVTGWILQEQRRASLAKNPAVLFRRLTRREYERTMQDLLGLPIEFGSRLPEDGRSKEGFRNDGDALRMSPLQYEMYLQIADEALAEAIVSGAAPQVHRYRLEAKKPVVVLPKPADRPGKSYDYAAKGQGFTIGDECSSGKGQPVGTLLPAAPRPHGEAALARPEFRYGFRLHHPFRRGETLIKVRAARGESEPGMESSRPPQLGLGLGCTNLHGVELKNVGEPIVIDHAEFRTYEFRVRSENFPLPNPGRFTDQNCSVILLWNAAPKPARPEANPPKLKIDWIEFESPYLEVWPPASHTNILFPNMGMSEPDYAREVVRRFASRAYREPVGKAELDRLMGFWANARKETDALPATPQAGPPAGGSLESSLRETLSLVLTSSRFLALPASRSAASGKERLTDHELAARLSYFLWSSMPDETLLQLAAQSKLSDPSVLSGQVRRMIKDPRAWQFIEQFAEQWLELDRLQRVTVNKNRYPEFSDQLAAAMRLETIHFFAEVLRGDLSIMNFLSSDFTFVNEPLAAHYGIPAVQGSRFRKVKLDQALQRGGVLTHASVLTGNSDGSEGHPIKRGMWLLKNLLDDPPPPPPPNVPELDRANNPQLKGLSITQALALHRSNTACAACHTKIDPWGIAFEEYDALGNWRKLRTSQPVNSRAELPTGVSVNGMRELKDELLRSKADVFRRAMLRKVAGYALGRSLNLTDAEAMDALVPVLKKRDDRLPALIELIVASDSFQSK
jgi:mono/diheme cytochrome c family protein